MEDDPLKAFLDDIAPLKRDVERIDITDFSASGRSMVLLWREPDALAQYQAGVIALELLSKYRSSMTPDEAQDVARIASFHVGEEAERVVVPNLPPAEPALIKSAMNPALFYASMARNKENPRLWNYVIAEARRLFPHLYLSTDEVDHDALKKYLAGKSPSAAATSATTPTGSPKGSPAPSGTN